MCTLAIYFKINDELPLVVAANRDEFYDRPATAPSPTHHNPWIIAGRDLVAGGTWLGVNEHHLVAGVLNRRTPVRPDPARCSRGTLSMEVLHHLSVADAQNMVCAQPAADYNPFNLLVASPTAAAVIGNLSGKMVATPLTPGLHLLTNLNLNDTECPRIAKSYALFDGVGRWLRADAIDNLVAGLREILSDHSTPLDTRLDGPPNNLCMHTQLFGTRSSTILAYSAAAARFRMWHADGPPCQYAYQEVPLPAVVSHEVANR